MTERRNDLPGALGVSLLLGHVFAFASYGAEPARIDFGKQVRPILAQRCLECHGPEEQEGGLRLDLRSGALRGGDSGKAIEPGQGRRSHLVERLVTSDTDLRMPSGKPPLTADEIAAITRWIDEGAEWPDVFSGDPALTKATHWSFRPIERPPLPDVKQAAWVKTPIDHFVLARLEGANLSPSPEASRAILLRRVYLDLIGLPPTPAEVDDFERDARPDAYERVVDQLLGSPAYGERWARRWLDLARYADTNGYEKDRPRSIWPYRDWVIHALNDDLPFDQFTIKQLAGDMLPQATLQDRVATGFHRNTMLNEEGGIDPLEFRFHAMVDRVHTTATTWLGLTVACAQCHSHKYDPISQREYYSFMALLNNADEPDLALPDAEVDRQREQIEKQIAALEAELPHRFEIPAAGSSDAEPSEERRREWAEQQFANWLEAESARAISWRTLPPAEASSKLPRLTIQDDASVLASGDQTKSDTYDVKFRTGPVRVTAIRLEALPHDSLPLNGPGRAYYEGPKGDFFLSEFGVRADGQPVSFSRATHDYSKLAIGGGDHGAHLTFDGNTTTGWSTKGREGEPHAAVFVLAEPVEVQQELDVRMLFERHYSCGLGRFRISITSDDKPAEARGHSAEIEAMLVKPSAERTPAETSQLFRRFLQSAPELAKAREEIEKLRESLPKTTTTLVMAERSDDHPRPTHLHHRGEFLQPKETVEPGTPKFLPSLPAGQLADRLTFANWLMSRDNPLTARVTVNRQWQAFFGRGLVRTTEDFGLQGELPSHPDLLDWLASELSQADTPAGDQRDSGWSLKRLHRLIVTSATYRQASEVNQGHLQADPENVLLSRGPRVRLEAEILRDTALRAADLLTFKLGGPSIFPPQPASVTTEGTYGALPWKASSGEDRYRRSLYTYMKRTAPFALFLTFDGPSGEACLARRDVSNSPLQALALLNDVVFVEAAQGLAKLVVNQPADDDERVAFVFRRCLSRRPTESEREALVQFARRQRERFAAMPERAVQLAGSKDDAVELATWVATARIVLNLDEMVVK